MEKNQRIENFITRLESTIKAGSEFMILEGKCAESIKSGNKNEEICQKSEQKQKAYKMRLSELKDVLYGLFEK